MRFGGSYLVTSTLALVVFAVLATAPSVRAQSAEDMCRDVLVYAAHNTYQNLSTHSMRSDVRSAMCSSYGSNSGSSSSFNGGLTVFGYGGGNVGQARQRFEGIQSNTCTSGGQALGTDDYDFVLKNIVDHDAIDAWNDCMNRDGRGLRGIVELNGSDVVFTVWWEARFAVAATRVTPGGSISGLTGTCARAQWPAVGATINSAKQSFRCTRNGKSPITLVINTDADSLVLKVSPPTPPPAIEKVSAREKCFQGDLNSCADAAAEAKASCDTKQNECGTSMACLASARSCLNAAICLQDLAFSVMNAKMLCAGGAASSSACLETSDRRDQQLKVCRTGYN